MIQCSECEHFQRSPSGGVRFKCDPFSNIKEPECLAKWQLIKLGEMVQAYQATVAMYRRLAPLQEKMMRHMEREMDDIDDADKWKHGLNDEEEDEGKDEEAEDDERP